LATVDSGNRIIRWEEDLRDLLMSMEFIDKANGADKMKLIFDDPRLLLRDDERVAQDARIGVLFGYPGITHGDGPVIFQVKERKGFRQLTLEGTTSGCAPFIGRQRTRTWEDATEFEVAEEIARELGFDSDDSLDIDPGDNEQIRRGITQASESDWEFLHRLAARIDCVCYVSGSAFNFHPPRYGDAPARILTYFDSNEGEFTTDPEIEISPIGRAGRATRRGISTEERAVVSGTAGNDDDSQRVVCGSELAVTDPGGWEDLLSLSPQERRTLDSTTYAQESVAPTTADTDEEAARSARRVFRSSEREAVKLSATLVGDPGLMGGITIRIEGLGPQLSGNYYIEEATHKIEGGYDTKIKAKRNALGQSGATATRRRQALNEPSTEEQEQAAAGFRGAFQEAYNRTLNLDPNCRTNDLPQTRLPEPVFWEDLIGDQRPE
jgi:phage protein D